LVIIISVSIVFYIHCHTLSDQCWKMTGHLQRASIVNVTVLNFRHYGRRCRRHRFIVRLDENR